MSKKSVYLTDPREFSLVQCVVLDTSRDSTQPVAFVNFVENNVSQAVKFRVT